VLVGFSGRITGRDIEAEIMTVFIARSSVVVGTMLIAFSGAAHADPSDRVARLSVVGGTVSFHPAQAANWTAASLNYPMTTGGDLWTDAGGRAELQLGTAVVRLDAHTFVEILNLDGLITQLRLTQGTVAVNVRDLSPDGRFEIDTPNGAVSLLALGTYRIEVDADGGSSTVTVRHGQAAVVTGAAALDVGEADAATMTGITAPAVARAEPAAPDDWEAWSDSRDGRRTGAKAQMYVAPDVIGYDDLDEFGNWDTNAGAEPIWIPRVSSDWAPFRFGHWARVAPWGWTWIDDARWGFAPSHYGRWTMWQGQWAWAPGDLYPLAPGDQFEPGYRVSPGYVRAVNAAESAEGAAAPDQPAHANWFIPGALTAVSRETFVQGQSVASAMIPMPPAIAGGPTAIITGEPAAPDGVSIVAPDPHVPIPPAVVQNRLVVARTLPPGHPPVRIVTGPGARAW
jgi:hypothetical protein